MAGKLPPVEEFDDPGAVPGSKRAMALKLTIIARQMHRRFDQSVSTMGATRSQWTLIAVVAQHPGITQREAAAMLEMSEASAGRLVERMCGEGLIERRAKQNDRRAYLLYVSDAAGSLLRGMSRIADEQEDRVFAGLDPDDLARLDTYLDTIAANLTGSR